MRKAQTILAHLNLAFGTLFLVLWVINIVNPKMQFLSSGVTNVFLVLFCLVSIAFGITTIVLHRRYIVWQQERVTAATRARRMSQGQGPAPVRPPIRPNLRR